MYFPPPRPVPVLASPGPMFWPRVVVVRRGRGFGGLSGLGSFLSADQIYAYARGAGFPPDTAVKITAIALRESGGNSQAFNGAGADQSYGLTQINMIGALGPARLAQFGLTDNAQLFDPATNMRAAYQLWAGDDSNLNLHWYIDRGGSYTAQYQANLPAALAAQAASGDDLGLTPLAIPGDAAGSPFLAGVDPATLALGAFGLLLVGLALD